MYADSHLNLVCTKDVLSYLYRNADWQPGIDRHFPFNKQNMKRFKVIRIWDRDEGIHKETVDVFFKILSQLNIPIISDYIRECAGHKLYTYIIEYNDEEFKEEYMNMLLKDFDLIPQKTQ